QSCGAAAMGKRPSTGSDKSKPKKGKSSSDLTEIPVEKLETAYFKLFEEWWKWTMQKFLLHDTVASNVFNRNFTSGYAAMVPWEKELTNNPEILETLCQRLSNDYEQTHQKPRKEKLQRRCAAFHARAHVFREKYPEDYVKSEETNLMKAFFRQQPEKDAELDVLLEESVPPADLSRIGIFRAPMAAHAKKAGAAIN
ncbi:unnamed protein product, partial [Durusdinium trenchii]